MMNIWSNIATVFIIKLYPILFMNWTVPVRIKNCRKKFKYIENVPLGNYFRTWKYVWNCTTKVGRDVDPDLWVFLFSWRAF